MTRTYTAAEIANINWYAFHGFGHQVKPVRNPALDEDLAKIRKELNQDLWQLEDRVLDIEDDWAQTPVDEWLEEVPRDQGAGDHSIRRWMFTLVGEYTLRVGPGRITRNGYGVVHTGSDKDVAGVDGTYYVVARLTSDLSGYDPRLHPEGVEIDTVDVLDEPWLTEYPLGEVTLKDSRIIGFVQYAFEDLGDEFILPDASSKWPTTDPFLSTIRHYSNGKHHLELGLYGSEGAWPGEYRFPFLDKDVNGTGALGWIVFDADSGGDGAAAQKSLQLNGAAVQIWDFDIGGSAAPGSGDLAMFRMVAGPEVDYADADAVKAWLGLEAGGDRLPPGDHTGDLLVWDNTAEAWVLLHPPSSPAVLAWDATGGVHWAEAAYKYQVFQRSAASTVIADYVRAV